MRCFCDISGQELFGEEEEDREPARRQGDCPGEHPTHAAGDTTGGDGQDGENTSSGGRLFVFLSETYYVM